MNDSSTISPPASDYLARAAWHGNVTAVQEWLRKGLKMEEPVAGRTPLLWAIFGGHEDVVKLLLQKGADISQKAADGDTALIHAVWSGNAKLVQMLLDKGFDPAEKGVLGKDAMDWAEEGDCAAVLQVLREAIVARNRAAAKKAEQEACAISHATAAGRQERLKERAVLRRKIRPAL
jgi:ankyrin repeat protein